MGIRVQKFGGSSIANITMINNVARRIVKAKEEGDQVVVVLSAMGDTTDELLEKVQGITSHPPEREIDMLLSTGEQVSIALMAMAITELGYPAVSMTGYQAGIQTDNAYTRARILNIEPERISGELEQDKIVIVAGFQGMNRYNDITTLGRGGSDTTAVALAAALKADICEIYTDVDGVYTADPRIEPRAKKAGFYFL